MKSLGQHSQGKKNAAASSSAPHIEERKESEPASSYASGLSNHDAGADAVREAYGGIDGILRRKQAERKAELDLLGNGRGVDPTYRGQGHERNMRLMSEDPRLGYQVNRPEDDLSGLDSAKHALASAPGKAADKAKEALTTSTGRENLGKDAASSLVNFIPFVEASRSAATVARERGRQERDEAIAGDEKADPLTRGMATGLASGHKATMAKQSLSGAASLIPIPGVGAAVSAVGSEATESVILDGQKDARRGARMPERRADEPEAAYRARVDAANQKLPALAAADPEYGKKTLAYLEQKPQKRLEEELATARKLQNPQEKVTSRTTTDKHLFGADEAVTERLDPATGKLKEVSRRDLVRPEPDSQTVEEHTLKPSGVAALSRMETARVAQREQMGAPAGWNMEAEGKKTDVEREAEQQSATPNRLRDLVVNEEKSFYENR